MTTLVRSSLMVLALGATLGAQQEGPPAPANAPRAPRGAIEDIEAYRVEPLSYVRRAADRVHVDADLLDLGGDVVLSIDGQPVPKAAFARRAIMFGGLQEVGKVLTTHITDEEIERLVAAGADRTEFELDEADKLAKYEDYLALIKMQAQQAAGADAAKAEELAAEAVAEFEASIEAAMGMEAFLNSLSAESRFEKVFLRLPVEPTPLPEDYPSWLPNEPDAVPLAELPPPPFVSQTTWDALSIDDNAIAMRQLILSAGKEGTDIPAIFKGQITSAIRLGILENLGLTWFFDDSSLPGNVICRLGDFDVTVEQVWPVVAPELNSIDHELILREMLTLRAMRDVLQAADRWLSDEEAAEAFHEYEAQFAGTLFPVSVIITFQGYSDLDRFREHHRYKAAYIDWRTPQLTEEELEDHYRRGGRLFFEKGNVAVDLTFQGSEANGGFTPEAFATAERKLLESVSELTTEAEWRAAAASLPKPVFRQQVGVNERTFERNQLRLRLSESTLSIFQRGYSMADDIFYHGVPGEVFGPTRMDNRRHAWGAEVNTGVWMGRVASYASNRPLAPMVDRNRDQAREDYLDLNFVYWSQECLEQLLPRVGPPSAAEGR